MEVNGQLHAPVIVTHQGGEAGWATEPVWKRWRENKSYPCPESNPGRPPRSFVIMLTELPWIFFSW
jgi:hypothetical protein